LNPSSATSRNALIGASLVVIGAASIQWSAALVHPAFIAIGPSASSAWRFLLGALMLLGIARPRVARFTTNQWLSAFVFGTAVAFMNLCFYQAIARIPLGTAVVIEFLGPLLVAALGKRTWRHFAFVVLAGLGVLALTRPGGGVTFVGALFALGAGAGWALYLFAMQRVGGASRGIDTLAIGVGVAALWSLPFALGRSHEVFTHPYLLGRIALVAFLALVIGFGAEIRALRRLTPSVVGVLVASDPAIAFVIGWMLLNERISPWDVVGLVCVILASIGVTRDESRRTLEVAR
jgi:inner membrane transporter RhtA